MSRLLVTAKPYADESFTGYFLRVSLLNLITPQTLFSTLSISKTQPYHFYNLDTREICEQDLLKLSEYTGKNMTDLLALQFSISINSDNISICEKSEIPSSSISVVKAKVCPECLSDKIYFRKHWSIMNVTACKNHKVILIDCCEKCSEPISWRKLNIFKCKCGHEHKNSISVESPVENLILSAYITSHLYGEKVEPTFKNNIFEIRDFISFNVTLLFLLKHLKGYTQIQELRSENLNNLEYANLQRELLTIIGDRKDGFFNFFERIKNKPEEGPVPLVWFNIFSDDNDPLEDKTPFKYQSGDNIVKDFRKFNNELFHEKSNHNAYQYLRKQFLIYLAMNPQGRYKGTRLVNRWRETFQS